jgi:hypothetical protein
MDNKQRLSADAGPPASRAKSEVDEEFDKPLIPATAYEDDEGQVLPDELLDGILDTVKYTQGHRINRRQRARHPAPTNAVRFLNSAPHWTLDGVLDHLREIKNYTEAGKTMNQGAVHEGITQAIENFDADGGLPLLARVLHVLYPLDGAALEFTRLQHVTVVAVQPIFESLPELWYIRLKDDDVRGGFRLGVLCNDSTPLKEIAPSKIPEFLNSQVSGFGFKLETEKVEAKKLEFDSCWAEGATIEQQKALVSHLHNESMHLFQWGGSRFICTDLLFKALRKDKRVVPFPRIQQPLIRDACV